MPAQLPATRSIQLIKLAATDVVPRLRSDLKVTADLSGDEGQIHITDPRNNASYYLKEVEFSLARMCNGKRTANDVVLAASKLGLPVTLDALTRFVGKLHALGMLTTEAEQPSAAPASPTPGVGSAPADGSGSTWPVREEWPPPQRGLYQQAIKAFRSESFDEATQAIDQFLSVMPAAKEAQDLKKRIERKKLAWAGAQPPRTFSQEFTALEATWFAEGESGEWMKNLPPEPSSQVSAPPAKGSRLPLYLVGGMALVGVVALLVPFPLQVQAKATTRASSAPLNVNAPHAGSVASVEVKDGQFVEKGALLLKFDGADVTARLTKFKAELKDKEARLKKAKAPSPKTKAARAAMARADTAELKAHSELDAAKSSGKKAAIAKAEKAMAAATRAAMVARKAAVAAGGTDDPEQLKLEVAATTQQVEVLSADLAAAELKAPQAGTVTGVVAKQGGVLAKEGAVLRLEDVRSLAVDLAVTKSDLANLKVGQEVQVRLGGKKFTAKLSEVSATGVAATLDNSKGELKSGVEGTATIACGSKSALGRL